MMTLLRKWWRGYRPSKLVWIGSCVGTLVLTVMIGFNWAGWSTRNAIDAEIEQARADLAATICMNRFLIAPDAAKQLAALKDEAPWRQDDFIKKGTWAKFDRLEKPVPDAASICVDKLNSASLPAVASQASNSAPTSARSVVE